MADEQLLSPYVFPILFVGMWLVVTTVFGFASGWLSLQQRYAPGKEAALLTLRFRSGTMGMGVSLSGILTLSACRSGLRISIWKIFAPFQRPILVPWEDIRSAQSRSLFAPATQLSFGKPELGHLKIDAHSWERLREAAAAADARELPPALPHVTTAATARALALQWAAITLGAGSFSYLVPRLLGAPSGLPLTACFGFPAVVFGIAIAWRFFRQS